MEITSFHFHIRHNSPLGEAIGLKFSLAMSILPLPLHLSWFFLAIGGKMMR
jgi:hypothetical protein